MTRTEQSLALVAKLADPLVPHVRCRFVQGLWEVTYDHRDGNTYGLRGASIADACAGLLLAEDQRESVRVATRHKHDF